MRAIFQAIRALKPCELPAQHADLRQALCQFERANRGHQHELDNPKLTAASAPHSLNDAQDRSRAQSIWQSSWELLKALRTPSCRASLGQPEFDELLQARDATGLLERLCLRLAPTTGLGAPGYRRTTGSFTKEERNLECNIGYQAPGAAGYRAFRTLRFELGKLDTLADALAFDAKCRHQMAQLIADIDSWPEFGARARKDKLLSEARQSLDDTLRRFSHEERLALGQHWDLLKPAYLRG
jgi:hypothetical protein